MQTSCVNDNSNVSKTSGFRTQASALSSFGLISVKTVQSKWNCKLCLRPYLALLVAMFDVESKILPKPGYMGDFVLTWLTCTSIQQFPFEVSQPNFPVNICYRIRQRKRKTSNLMMAKKITAYSLKASRSTLLGKKLKKYLAKLELLSIYGYLKTDR